MDITEIYGKRLQADKAVTIFFGFPNSDSKKTLVPGAVSNRINSFLPSGFYELEANPGGKNQYVEDVRAVKVVEDNTKDESSVLTSVTTAFSDYFGATETRAKKTAGFVSEGFTETIKDFSSGALDFKNDLIKIALAAVAAVALIIIYKIWKL